MTRDEVLSEVRRMVQEAGSQKRLAKQKAIGITVLNQSMQGRAPLQPGFLRAIGFERVESYRRKDSGQPQEISGGDAG